MIEGGRAEARTLTVCAGRWLAYALLVVAVACGPGEEGGPAGSGEPTAEGAGTAEPTEASTEGAGWIGRVTLGSDIDAQGVIPPERQADRFSVGDVVFVSVVVDEPPVGAEVLVAFIGPDAEVVAEDAKRVLDGQGRLFVASGPTSAWSPGDYTVLISAAGAVVAEESFELAPG